MLTANWGIAKWADNPEMPPTRWETLETIPPEEREPYRMLTARLARHAAEQDAMLTQEAHDRLWPRRKWGVPA